MLILIMIVLFIPLKIEGSFNTCYGVNYYSGIKVFYLRKYGANIILNLKEIHVKLLTFIKDHLQLRAKVK